MNPAPTSNNRSQMNPGDPAAAREHFTASGYTVVRGAVPHPGVELYATYALLKCQDESFYKEENNFSALSRYADTMGESLLLHLQPTMEQNTGLSLLPCYSYLRIYDSGAVLPRHIDRPSCEVSASLTVGYSSSKPWPLFVEAAGQVVPIDLQAGDLLIYSGCDLPHWRDRFDGDYWIQVFLHYVRADGRYTQFRFDRRESIGAPKNPNPPPPVDM
jgi:hypothetical protein